MSADHSSVGDLSILRSFLIQVIHLVSQIIDYQVTEQFQEGNLSKDTTKQCELLSYLISFYLKISVCD